jgi:thiol-disulfide isomerase/thioredoxin
MATAQPPTAAPEELAPDFAFSTLQGKTLRLADLRGKTVILAFWATWCEPCRADMPLLEQFGRDHAERVVVVGMNVREPESVTRPFIESLGITFPVGNAPEAMLREYQVISLPLTFIIAPDGRLIKRFYGALSAERLLSALP